MGASIGANDERSRRVAMDDLLKRESSGGAIRAITTNVGTLAKDAGGFATIPGLGATDLEP